MENGDTLRFYETANLRAYSEDRKPYLDAVDKLVIHKSPAHCSILDVGSGDGVRIQRIAAKLRARVTAIDISPQMSKLAGVNGCDAHCADISEFRLSQQFDVITCLWSVLGYTDPRKAIDNMALMLKKDGVLFADINIRYNIAAYGLGNCLRNMKKTILGETDNLFPVKNSPCKVYLFDYWELDECFRAAGLSVQKVYLNYETGMRTVPFFGQLLYIARHNTTK